MKNDRVVQNWIELQKLVFEDSWHDSLKRFRSPFAFRGSSDKNKNLFSSLTFNQRIINQFALFSLVSDPSYPLHKWLEQHTDLYFRLIIPTELKMEIRDKLDQANITERVLFPGLDGVIAWLKRHYRYNRE